MEMSLVLPIRMAHQAPEHRIKTRKKTRDQELDRHIRRRPQPDRMTRRQRRPWADPNAISSPARGQRREMGGSMTHGQLGTLVLAGLVSLVSTGCALSNSLGSIADSASSPFEWSSSISGGASGAYRHEIREQVLAFAESGGSVQGFQRELSAVARRHGLLNWEVEPATYRALGEGLRAAGITGPRFDRLKEQLSDGHAERMRAVQQGYDDWDPERVS